MEDHEPLARPGTRPRVREATPHDHAAIRAVLADGYSGFPPDTSYLDHVLDAAAWMPDATATFVASADGRVVGVVALAVAPSPLHESVVPPSGDAGFRFLAVSRDARGGGIGRMLVEACLEGARARGCRRVAIFTMDFMQPAQRLYEYLGFTRRPDLDVRFPGGDGLALTMDLVPDADAVFGPAGPAPAHPPWYQDVFAAPDDLPDP